MSENWFAPYEVYVGNVPPDHHPVPFAGESNIMVSDVKPALPPAFPREDYILERSTRFAGIGDPPGFDEPSELHQPLRDLELSQFYEHFRRNVELMPSYRLGNLNASTFVSSAMFFLRDSAKRETQESAQVICVTEESLREVMQFVSWLPDWAGHSSDRIDYKLATHALKIASDMRTVAREPLIAPTVDGTLLLQWDFEDDSSVEVYVESDSQFPKSAVLDVMGEISDVELLSEDHLAMLLKQRMITGRSV